MHQAPPISQVPDTLAFLLGTWRLDRSIEDRRTATRGSFAGEASLIETPSAGGAGGPRRARYEEVGDLQFGAHHGPARRSLEYISLDEACVRLCFADGRPYIDLDLTTGACDRVHDCGEDRYEISVVVRSRDLVEERWLVQGPHKHYEALTTLTRCQASGRHTAAW